MNQTRKILKIFMITIQMIIMTDRCCGWVRSAFTVNTELPRICGKTDFYSPDNKFVTKGTWPWLGFLLRQDMSATRCNVILLHTEVAITGAACVGTNIAEELYVQFSTKDLTTFQSALVSNIDFLYPNAPANNIALLKLSKKIQFNQNVMPICMWEQNSDYSVQLGNQIGMAAGSDLSNNTQNFRIYQAPVLIASTQSCSRSEKNYYESFLKGSICLLYRDGKQCHYIGSALMLPRLSEDGLIVWYLRGLQTLRVWYCGNGKYTPSFDLAPHRSWIDSHFKKSSLQSGCGRRMITETPLIIGGNETMRGDFPWHVALYKSNSTQMKKFAVYNCGGTLVSSKFVVTAAHCLTYPQSDLPTPLENLVLVIGKYDLSRREPGAVVDGAAKIIIHEEYEGTTFVNDIGLIQLQNPVQFGPFIQPACLWDTSTISKRNIFNKYGDVPGWGFDENDSVRSALRVATIPIIEDSICYASHESFFVKNLNNRTFCAGYGDPSSSVCNGDSGGGLVLPMRQTDQRDTYFLRGLVSFSISKPGKRICDPNYYTLFTDVAYFTPWIESKMSSA